MKQKKLFILTLSLIMSTQSFSQELNSVELYQLAEAQCSGDQLYCQSNIAPEFATYLEAVAYRKAQALCHSLMTNTKNFMSIDGWVKAILNDTLNDTPVHPEMTNSHKAKLITEGSQEWALIQARAFFSAGNHLLFFLPLLNIGPLYHGDTFWPRLTQYLIYLVNRPTFKEGLIDCAKYYQYNDTEQFAHTMKDIILDLDRNITQAGAFTGISISFLTGGMLFKSLRLALNALSRRSFYQVLSNTRVSKILKSRYDFLADNFKRHKWIWAGGTAGIALPTGLYFYSRIREEHKVQQATIQVANNSTLVDLTGTMFNNIQQSFWPTRLHNYRSRIINKLDAISRLTPGSIEHNLLEQEFNIYLEHHLNEYWSVKQRVDEIREVFSTGIEDKNLRNQYHILNEVLEHFTMKKNELEAEIAKKHARAFVEDYDRYEFLNVLFELIEIRKTINDFEVCSQCYELQKRLLDYRNMRLQNLRN